MDRLSDEVAQDSVQTKEKRDRLKSARRVWLGLQKPRWKRVFNTVPHSTFGIGQARSESFQ